MAAKDIILGKTEIRGTVFFSEKDGSIYEGDDVFAAILTSGLIDLMAVKDDEVQARMGVMLTSKFNALMEKGEAGDNNGNTYSMKDGSRKPTSDQNGTDPSVIGVVVIWNPSYRQTAVNGIQNPNGADPILDLAHELLGHC